MPTAGRRHIAAAVRLPSVNKRDCHVAADMPTVTVGKSLMYADGHTNKAVGKDAICRRYVVADGHCKDRRDMHCMPTAQKKTVGN